MIKAILLHQQEKQTVAELTELPLNELPDNGVTIDVEYSSLNYKDGLAITGAGRVITQFPMVPGIDCAGTVSQSNDPRYHVGEKVILTGWGVGESHWGGMAEKAVFKAEWLVPMPINCNSIKAMKIGTAGLTAMLSVQALQAGGVTPESGDILVTGASGGVGSVAVTLLTKLGYHVVAATGRVEQNANWLASLGAKEVIDRSELDRDSRPLEKQLWGGLIDTVGNRVLATALSQMKYGAAVAICGLAGGFTLPTTVMPFILRGVRMQGIDSVYCPYEIRKKAWEQLIELLPEQFYQQACETIYLKQVPEYAEKIIKGQIKGRVVIKI